MDGVRGCTIKTPSPEALFQKRRKFFDDNKNTASPRTIRLITDNLIIVPRAGVLLLLRLVWFSLCCVVASYPSLHRCGMVTVRRSGDDAAGGSSPAGVAMVSRVVTVFIVPTECQPSVCLRRHVASPWGPVVTFNELPK